MPAKVKKNLISKPDVETDYAAFLSGIKLVALGLQECNANIDRGTYFELLDKKNIQRRISASYFLDESTSEYFNVSASLTLTVDSEKEHAAAMSIACKYEAHFHCDRCKINKDFASRFTNSELRLVIWPYFRQLVNDMTSRMLVPPILIPFSTTQGNTEAR